MLSQKDSKFIQSLKQKKFRQKYNLFVVEGKKLTKEIQDSHFDIEKVYVTENYGFAKEELISVSEMKKISNLKNPSSVLAVVKIPSEVKPDYFKDAVLLDSIQDPGNLGTIIRTADWFGVSQIICSAETVDVYNPKVVQATMGSLARVKIIYLELEEFIEKFTGTTYAADMNGQSIYTEQFNSPFALIMGNEGNGISKQLLKNSNTIAIPNFSQNQEAESLNVSIATAIILSEIKRN